LRGQRHVPAASYPRERPGTHFTGGWVGYASISPEKIIFALLKISIFIKYMLILMTVGVAQFVFWPYSNVFWV